MTDRKGEGEGGQLSESAHSRTRNDNEPTPTIQPTDNAPQQDENAGKHGRPTDDSDPGHS
ncbi:hypothetical protein DEIPH_ctg021orf0064 [Deinococcus phoenicis]|uniref:Uncharacterized protein n=1 Tax=Deinococcus phoenicis TaxID=1476583 RepID=A0A016QRR1_9DEIO|nr:hypothetical protein [Deinococcus phoenicis]EYB68547.1 hypothetical protein DEIPH_ctg021orf0064 [Deinococcus phoenicis]